MGVRQIFVFDDISSLEEAAAREIVRTARNAVSRRGVCHVALAGGSTPRGVYARLSEEPHRGRIDWSKVHLFWGDERCVPPDDPKSNYRMAHEALLSRTPLHESSVHRIHVELGPERAAAAYEEEIRAVVGGATPRFDLILLGMGADGHTASLFPNTPALRQVRQDPRLVAPTVAPSPPRRRVTLTLRAINAARKVMFLVAGGEKARTLARVFEEGGRTSEGSLPAALVRPPNGRLLWMVDRSAAARSSSAGNIGFPNGGRFFCLL